MKKLSELSIEELLLISYNLKNTIYVGDKSDLLKSQHVTKVSLEIQKRIDSLGEIDFNS